MMRASQLVRRACCRICASIRTLRMVILTRPRVPPVLQSRHSFAVSSSRLRLHRAPRENRRAQQTTRRPLRQHRQHILAHDERIREAGRIVRVGVGVVHLRHNGLQETEYAPDDEGRPRDHEDDEDRVQAATDGPVPVLGVSGAVVPLYAEEPRPAGGEGSARGAILSEGEVKEYGEEEVDGEEDGVADGA